MQLVTQLSSPLEVSNVDVQCLHENTPSCAVRHRFMIVFGNFFVMSLTLSVSGNQHIQYVYKQKSYLKRVHIMKTNSCTDKYPQNVLHLE